MAHHFSFRDRVVHFEQLAPLPIAEIDRALSGADDIREHHRCQDSLQFRACSGSGQKPRDLVEDCVLITDIGWVIGPGELDELRIGDVVCEERCVRCRPIGIFAPLENERRRCDRA